MYILNETERDYISQKMLKGGMVEDEAGRLVVNEIAWYCQLYEKVEKQRLRYEGLNPGHTKSFIHDLKVINERPFRTRVAD